ncbi:MAG: SufD family Fe-S cluster assembly protein, partial [Acidimicrobiia bacterium]|nr:SufD family Fe-S cluster assembly protein [Acidimicrobiia bacterium]
MTANVTATAISDRPAHSPADRLDGVERPTRRDEAWRYAPHDLLGRLTFGPPPASGERSLTAIADRIPSLDGPRIVIVNGVVDSEQSDIAALPDGLRVAGLAADSAGPTGLVAAHFNADSGFAADAFVRINKTFGIGGAFIEVADGHRLADPIHLVDLVVPDETRNTPCRGAIIHIGQGSSATIVETRTGSGTAFGGLNTRTSITLEANANLDHVLLQDMPATQVHLSRVEVTQRAGSTLRARSFNLGAVYGRVAYDVHLTGVGAHADLSGLYFGSGAQTLDQQITVVHAARDCTSRQSYRGVLDDQSTGVFNGG